ncbi:hypothetical protein ACN47A_27655 [Myxococcus fulvus]|uniref:hypothetical protein n=1 Tax=Myxococcus fulvus TaxID=33 RepID=UPI003B99F96D
MGKQGLFVAVASAVVLLSASGRAREPRSAPKAGAVCAKTVPLTAQLVEDAAESGLQGVETRDDLLIGTLSYLREPSEAARAASGTVLFIKGPKGWRAVLPQHEENEVGVYLAPKGRRLVVVTQRQIGDPGQSFTVVGTSDGFTTSTCATLPFPRELNQPTWNGEYLTLHDLDLDARGRGVLIGSASLERQEEPSRTLWFSYATRDGGRTWGAPRTLTGQQDAPSGTLVPARRVEAPALVTDLRAFARGDTKGERP